MEKEIKGATEFCKMLAIYIKKEKDRGIVSYTDHLDEGIRTVFRIHMYQLFTLYLNEKEKRSCFFPTWKKCIRISVKNYLNFFLSLDLSLKINQNKVNFRLRWE